MALKTDFVDALFEQKKIRLNENEDGTVTPVDETEYTRQGDKFGAEHINATNEAVNGLSKDMVSLKNSVSDGKAQVAAAITAKRVPTAATATFGEMADNIGKIILGSGNAAPSDVLAGKTFTNNDGKEYTGTMPNRGDYWGWGNSKGNDAGSQRMWVKIPQGYYNENANVLLSWADIRNMAGITPEKVKKNEWILGMQGNFEGWVPAPQDLYYNGVNSVGFTPSVSGANARCEFQAQQIYFNSGTGSSSITSSAQVDITGCSYLVISGHDISLAKNDSVLNSYAVDVKINGTQIGTYLPSGDHAGGFRVNISSQAARRGVMQINIYSIKNNSIAASSKGYITKISLE